MTSADPGMGKRIDLLSIAGAAPGALFARALLSLAYPLSGIGLLVQRLGMRARDRVDSRGGPLPLGWRVLYGVCRVAIDALPVAATVQQLSIGGQ